MSERPPEELLWEAPRAEAGRERSMPTDSDLRAYREGRLSEIEERRLEWVLGRSAKARARLAEIAGAPLARPRGWLRRKVLGRPETARRGGARSWQLAAAVLIAGAMISLAILRDSRNAPALANPLPDGLAFDVRVEGLAATRSSAGGAEAYPDTRVRITVEPRGDAVSGLEFAVYVPEPGGVRRLEPGTEIVVEAHRGAAALMATAASLVGSDPGEHEFFIVVGADGALPSGPTLDLTAATATEVLVYRRELTILDTR